MRLAISMGETRQNGRSENQLPVYVYRCEQCGSEMEKRQAFTDAPLTECGRCGGRLRKVLTPAVVIYKGSGFYSTAYNGKSGGNGRNGSSEKQNGSEKDESKSSAETKPAGEAKEPAKSATASED